MTPAIDVLITKNISYKLHEYAHEENTSSYGLEASMKLGVPAEQVFKTLIVALDSGELVVGILPVSSRLSMKLIAKVVGAKKAKMAETKNVERSTGYVLGGISPLGQRRRLKTVIDTSADQHSSIFVSAGRRGLQIELSPQDLTQILDCICAEICQ